VSLIFWLARTVWISHRERLAGTGWSSSVHRPASLPRCSRNHRHARKD
jgi:hypothetical protein